MKKDLVISNGIEEISFKDSHSCIVSFNEDHVQYYFTTHSVYDILLKAGQEYLESSQNTIRYEKEN